MAEECEEIVFFEEYATQFLAGGRWCAGAYIGPDEDGALVDCRKLWRRGADGVRVLVTRTVVVKEHLRNKGA